MRFCAIVCLIMSCSAIAGAAPSDDKEVPLPSGRLTVRNLPELRSRLSRIEKSRDFRRRAISLHEEGKVEKARLFVSWTNAFFPEKPDAEDDVQQLRAIARELDEYHLMMTRALEMHDKGKVAEAHRVSSEAASRFPKQPGARWFAEQTKDGQGIPPGGSIEFINRTDQVIASVVLHYRHDSSILGLKRVRLVVRELKPGKTQSVYTDDLPKGPIRLYAEFRMDVNGEVFNVMSSARILGSAFGVVPTVIIEKDGSVSFSQLRSAMRTERAKNTPPSSIEAKSSSLKKS